MKNTANFSAFGDKLQRFATIVWAALIWLFAGQAVQAQQWHFDPVIKLGYEYDDNAPLATNPDSNDEAQGYLLEASAAIGTATERTTFDFTPMIRSRNYDEERFDSDDGFARIDFNHQGLTSNFRFRGSYAQESVRTADRADADPDITDPDEILGNDAGNIFVFGDRKSFWLFPQWTYNFSERSAISAAVRYLDVDYDDILPGSRIPYTDARIEAAYAHSLSTRTRWYIRASAGRFERDDPGILVPTEVDGLGLGIGIERGLTETMRIRAEVGYAETEPDSGFGESDSDIVWDFNLIRNLETVTLLAQYKRSVNSDGDGRLTLRDSFNLSVKNQFSERLEGGLGVRAYTTDQLSSDNVPFEERDYAQLQATLSYAISRTFLIEGDYRYTYTDRSLIPDNAKSNSIIIWFTWEPNRR